MKNWPLWLGSFIVGLVLYTLSVAPLGILLFRSPIPQTLCRGKPFASKPGPYREWILYNVPYLTRYHDWWVQFAF